MPGPLCFSDDWFCETAGADAQKAPPCGGATKCACDHFVKITRCDYDDAQLQKCPSGPHPSERRWTARELRFFRDLCPSEK